MKLLPVTGIATALLAAPLSVGAGAEGHADAVYGRKMGMALAFNALVPADKTVSPDVFSQLQQNAWYLPTKDGTARLYVTELGEGPPIVFLHGGPGNDFHYIVDALRPHTDEARFILFDQRGSLMSPVPDARVADLTAEMLVGDLEHLREALGEEKMVLFGHSWGSLLALLYFDKHPENVAGLILAASFPPATEGGVAKWMEGLRTRQAELIGRQDEIAVAVREAGLPENPVDDTPKQSSMRWRIEGQAPIMIVDLARWREATGAGGGVYYNLAAASAVGSSLPATFNFVDLIRSHDVPVAVIQGDRDYIGPGAPGWKKLSREGAPVTVTVLPRSNHHAWIDAPEGFRDALREAIRTTRSR